jgi:putative copper export protein
MDVLFWFNVLVRWIHVTMAALAVGGLVYAGLVMLPALRAGGEGARPAGEAVAARFRILIHSAIGLLLLTGGYNLAIVIPRASALGDSKSLYHGVLGTKILLALVLFGIASVVVSRRAAQDAPPPGAARPLSLAIGLGLVILLLSAVLRRMWDLVGPQ